MRKLQNLVKSFSQTEAWSDLMHDLLRNYQFSSVSRWATIINLICQTILHEHKSEIAHHKSGRNLSRLDSMRKSSHSSTSNRELFLDVHNFVMNIRCRRSDIILSFIRDFRGSSGCFVGKLVSDAVRDMNLIDRPLTSLITWQKLLSLLKN